MSGLSFLPSKYVPNFYLRNTLLIRLLKILRQPTTGFALLGAHQGIARVPTLKRKNDYDPQPKPLAQKPNRKTAVFGRKCKFIAVWLEMQVHYRVYRARRHTCFNRQPGGPADCVRRTSNY
ncbi:hypothetical protein CSKR_109151 [Clonorchis sinensis]|uniref:Uncharacterized protein n=1 Tax=Clonorchis sinensis TaxID=79923 RepID=A0A419Q9B0_CLOSI|nr:hypothetical protein CSKR_109151 [Clonorchis sinensis]